ncbi:MAG: trypsin-like peptidase domain-containing protein [Acidobacteria bacterium]|nr:trypsin-like peptidase domain-containing protein [Acidobacteriota bacterium]
MIGGTGTTLTVTALVTTMAAGQATSSLPPVSSVVARTQPAVVSITGTAGALGSGFIVRADGIIATNKHVVTDVGALTVVLASGEKLPARVRLVHPQQDLALLQVEAGRALDALPLRTSAPVVGEWVVALGNPFGLGPTATIGIIGATGRSLGRTGDAAQLVQTDAAINPGNSGGPLVDMRGNAIAIANAAVTIGQGIGFGIPIQLVVDLLRDLKGP